MIQTSVLRPHPSSPAAPASFACTRSPGRLGAAWVHLVGELDLSNAAIVADQLDEAQASSHMVVVDLRELEFLDCAGVGLLVAADAQARREQKSLVLVRGGGQVARVLELTGLLETLEVVDLDDHQTGYPTSGAADAAREGPPQIQPAA